MFSIGFSKLFSALYLDHAFASNTAVLRLSDMVSYNQTIASSPSTQD